MPIYDLKYLDKCRDIECSLGKNNETYARYEYHLISYQESVFAPGFIHFLYDSILAVIIMFASHSDKKQKYMHSP